MNEVELTQLFVEFAQTKAHLVELEALIKQEVFLRKSSVKIAGVSAKYYNPSDGTPDYEASVNAYLDAHPLFDRNYLDVYSVTKVTFDWKDICHEYKIPLIAGEPKPARVVVS